jgi:hypothetical protein
MKTSVLFAVSFIVLAISPSYALGHREQGHIKANSTGKKTLVTTEFEIVKTYTRPGTQYYT